MKKLLICVLFSASVLAQSWQLQTVTNPPQGIAYGGIEWNRWWGATTGFWNGPIQMNIYANELGNLAYTGSTTQTYATRATNGDATTTCPTQLDTGSEPGSGHPGHNFAYDWREDIFILHQRLECGSSLNTVYTYVDSVDHVAAGPWTQNIALNAPNATANPNLTDGFATYDPVNGWMFERIPSQK